MVVSHRVLCILVAVYGNAGCFLFGPNEKNDRAVYGFESVVRLTDSSDVTGDDNADVVVAYKIAGEICVSKRWQNAGDEQDRLYYLQLSLREISTKTKGDAPYSKRSVGIENSKNEPFFIHWNDRRIDKIYLDRNESITIRNLKKAVASVLQFQETRAKLEERDISGLCTVTYQVIDPQTILKRKNDCITYLPVTEHPQKILGAERQFKREILYQKDQTSNIVRISSSETIDLSLEVRKNIGISIASFLDLNFIGTEPEANRLSSAQTVDEAVNEISNETKVKLQSDDLYLEIEPEGKINKSLAKMLKENRDLLTENHLGKVESAEALMRVLRVVQNAPESDIIKELKNKKNEPILCQLMDILGCAQTLSAHNAIMKVFDFVKPKDIDPLERYLWSIALGQKPKVEFVDDIKKILQKKLTNEKLKETLISVLAILSRKISDEMSTEAHTFIARSLDECDKKDENCAAIHLRAFKNLRHPSAVPILLRYAQTGTRLLSVTALKTLYVFPPNTWDTSVLNTAEKIYYQKDKIYDSSARTIAVDIIIDSNPDRQTLRNLLKAVQTNASFEARRYLLQRLQQTGYMNETFNDTLNELMKEENLYHYHFLAQRGLSNALSKVIYKDSGVTASIFSVNEVSKSVLKRSHVSFSVNHGSHKINVCALDMFTGGLGSFLWSDSTTEDEELDEPDELIAGMELGVHDIYARPFVFFHGHVELVGHMWAGTASTRTPILQTIGLLGEHKEYLALSSGNVIKFDLAGSASQDMAGQIEFSLWNRNAKSIIDSKFAVVMKGSACVNTAFVNNEVNFDVFLEAQVDVKADLDMYDEILFCLRIAHEDAVARFNIGKVQTIVKTNKSTYHKKRRKISLPGRTFMVNQKTNDMCNDIFKRP